MPEPSDALPELRDPFSSSAKSPELESGGKFFPELTSLDQAQGLEVFEWDSQLSAYNAFKIAFKDGVWTIPSKQGYPADAENKIGKIASALMALEKTKLRTSREEDHVRLGPNHRDDGCVLNQTTKHRKSYVVYSEHGDTENTEESDGCTKMNRECKL